MHYTILSSLFLLFLSVGGAKAQDINVQQADILKQKIAKMTEVIIKPFLENQNLDLDDLTQKITVVPMDEYYDVTYPENFVMQLNDDSVDKINIAMSGFDYKFFPTNNPSQYNVESLIGEGAQITVSAVNESESTNMFAMQFSEASTAKGLLDLDIGQYIQASQNAKGIKAQINLDGMGGNTQGIIDVSMDELSLLSDYKPNADGKLDGYTTMSLNGLAVSSPKGKSPDEKINVTIDNIQLKSAQKSWDIEKLKAINSMVMDENNEPSPIDFLDFLKISKTTVSKMDINSLKIFDEFGKELSSIEKLTYSGYLRDSDTDQMDVAFKFDMNGFLVAMDDEQAKNMQNIMPLLPDDFGFQFKMDQVPVQSLEKDFAAVFMEGDPSKDEMKNKLKQNQDKIIALLAQKGTSASLNFDMGGEKFIIDLDSDLKFSEQSPMKILGEMNLKFFNMDDYIKLVMATANDNKENPMVATGLPQAMGVAGMLQMMGQQGNDPEKGPYREYKVVLDEEGNTFLNGVPISQIMGGMMPKPQ